MQGGRVEPGSQGPSDFNLFVEGLQLCCTSWAGDKGERVTQRPLPGVTSLGILTCPTTSETQRLLIGTLHGKCVICVFL